MKRLSDVNHTSLTSILANKNNLYATRECVKYSDYYELFYAFEEKYAVIASESFYKFDFKLLENRQLLKIDKDNLYSRLITF